MKTFEHVHSLRQYNNVTDGRTDGRTDGNVRIVSRSACYRMLPRDKPIIIFP